MFVPYQTMPLAALPPRGGSAPLERARGLVAEARLAVEAELRVNARERARAGCMLRALRMRTEADALERRLGRLARIDEALAAVLAAPGMARSAVTRVCERVRWLSQVRDEADLEGIAHELERLAHGARAPQRDVALADAAVALTGRVQAHETQAAELAAMMQRTPDPVTIDRAARALDETLRALAIYLRLRGRTDDMADTAERLGDARPAVLALLGDALDARAPEHLARLAAEVEGLAA